MELKVGRLSMYSIPGQTPKQKPVTGIF